MDPYGKKELLSFYDRHLKDFGDRPQAVRWTPEGRTRRYDILLNIAGDPSGKKILDFGCGKGDFYGFLKSRSRGMSPDYLGVDINENLIKLARSKYHGTEFLALDIEEDNFDGRFDVIFLCGVFNLRVAGVDETLRNVLKRLFPLCVEALHLNALSYYSAQRSVELFYPKPEDLLGFAIKELSTNVVLRHGLIRGDFFLSVYK